MSALRVCHIITNTHVGGAEVALYNLLKHLDTTRIRSDVISLMERGPVGERIAALGIPVLALNALRYGCAFAGSFARLVSHVRRQKPDVVQTWMYHADLCGGVAAWLAGRYPTVWGVRHSTHDRCIDTRNTLRSARLCGRLAAWIPTKIALVSEAARSVHAELGYPQEKMVVIPNGFDAELFRPCATSRQRIRQELAIPEQVPLVLLCGRFHPHKDHETFVRAASLIAASLPECRFVLAGREVQWDNRQLVTWIERHHLRQHFHLLGPWSDMAGLYSAADVLVSSSISEAFPRVVGEAMCCGTTCVVTNVGDSAAIVGTSGEVVPPRDAAALAGAALALLRLPAAERQERGGRARQSIVDRFDIHRVAEQYVQLWMSTQSRPASLSTEPRLRQAA